MDKNKKPTVEELTAELAQEKAKNAHLKNLLDRALSEKAHLKRVFADREEDEKKREQKDEAWRKEINNLRVELEVQKYAKKFISIGMDEDRAEKTARAMLAKDEEAFHENIEMLIKETKADAQNEAIQQLLSERSEIHAGNGDAEIESAAVRFAKQYIGRQKVDTDTLRYFE